MSDPDVIEMKVRAWYNLAVSYEPRYIVVSPREWTMLRALERGETRRLDKARHNRTRTALKHLQRRAHRRRMRAAGYKGTLKDWWAKEWCGVSRTAHKIALALWV